MQIFVVRPQQLIEMTYENENDKCILIAKNVNIKGKLKR